MSSEHPGAPRVRSGQPPEPHEGNPPVPSRRGFLRASGVSIAGVTVLAGSAAFGPQASAEEMTSFKHSLMAEFKQAAKEHDVPVDLLLAMGYVNTRLEMPAPGASDYTKGDPEGRGTYGIMALVRNPSSDTLGKAAKLTGLSERRLKTDRAANIQGGAALLADAQGTAKPRVAARWIGAVHGRGGSGTRYTATTGVGGGELYAGQVDDALRTGFSVRVRSGERISLNGRSAN